MSKTYLVVTRRKPDFDPEQIAPHLDFLAALRSENRVGFSGPFSDKSGGAYILHAADLAEAQGIAHRDPLHTSNSSEILVYEWNVSAPKAD